MVNVKPVHLGKNVRMSFSRINEVLEMPNLIEVQKNSYKWFLEEGLKEVFLANVEKAKKTGGLELKELCRPAAAAFSQPSGDSLDRRIPQKQPGLYAVKYHPIGGLLPKEMPEKLYQILKEIPKAECRIAAHGTIYVINLSEAEAETVLRATEDGARTEFESSVACIGASICQQGVRDSQAVLAAAVKAVREAEIPDGALPKICISGCPSAATGVAGHASASIPLHTCKGRCTPVSRSVVHCPSGRHRQTASPQSITLRWKPNKVEPAHRHLQNP